MNVLMEERETQDERAAGAGRSMEDEARVGSGGSIPARLVSWWLMLLHQARRDAARRPLPVAVRAAVHLGALAPLASLLRDAAFGGLGVNPIQALEQRTGKDALVLLVLSLACTPASRLLGLRWAVPLRRTLGLYAFFYACLHLLIFSGVDFVFHWDAMVQEIAGKRYILAGLAAYMVLVPLALTSTKGAQRRLRRRWTLLHRTVYAAPALALMHFLWWEKADWREPLAYGVAVVVLLALRLPPLRRGLIRLRSRLGGSRARRPPAAAEPRAPLATLPPASPPG